MEYGVAFQYPSKLQTGQTRITGIYVFSLFVFSAFGASLRFLHKTHNQLLWTTQSPCAMEHQNLFLLSYYGFKEIEYQLSSSKHWTESHLSQPMTLMITKMPLCLVSGDELVPADHSVKEILWEWRRNGIWENTEGWGQKPTFVEQPLHARPALGVWFSPFPYILIETQSFNEHFLTRHGAAYL